MKISKLFIENINDYPVMVCSADGTIAILNPKAEEVLGRGIKNSDIYSMLSRVDKVLFDIVMNSTKPRPFTTAAKLPKGFDHMDLIPIDLGDSRLCFAIIRTSDDREYELRELTRSEVSGLVSYILEHESLRSYSIPSYPIFDMVDATKRIISDIARKHIYDLELDLKQLDEADSMVTGEMGLQNYVYLITAALSAINDLAGRKAVAVALLGNSGDHRLEIVAKSDRFASGNSQVSEEDMSSSCRTKLKMCELIAANNNLKFTSELEDGNMKMIIGNLSPVLDHDFKSHYRYEGYEDMLLRAIAAVGSL